MNRLIILFLIMVTATTSIDVFADNAKKQSCMREREQFINMQAENIANELKLEDATRARFIETYIRCQKEVWSICEHGIQKKADVSTMSEAEAKAYINKKIAHRNRLNEIREKYYEEYSTFLTQRQIVQLYNYEKKLMERMIQNYRTKNEAK